MRIDEKAASLDLTLPLARGSVRTIRIAPAGATRVGGDHGAGAPAASVEILGASASPRAARSALAAARHLLRLDEDLSGFYAAAASDPELAWVTQGAGRMLRSPTVFEDVVKTICTTNCAWSATERMVSALVEHLGERAPGAPATGVEGRAFPTPAAMAEAGDDFYTRVVRAGYRGRYLRDLARAVAEGELDLEALASASREELPDDEVHARLLTLPGVGPYAAAHVMLMLGRYSRLILDSWTRPTYARLAGKRRVADRTIERRYRRYGPYAGLAFWLFLTRDWV
jgi:N-glycosylase/DNA lyase